MIAAAGRSDIKHLISAKTFMVISQSDRRRCPGRKSDIHLYHIDIGICCGGTVPQNGFIGAAAGHHAVIAAVGAARLIAVKVLQSAPRVDIVVFNNFRP